MRWRHTWSSNDLHGAARTQINLGVASYFESHWADASSWYLAAMESAEAAGSVVLAANAAINSAEILADQGAWQRALELFDSAIRNFEAVRYVPGIGVALLFSAIPAMRSGDTENAAARLARAHHLLDQLGMNEFVADVESRRLELDLMLGTAKTSACDDFLQRLAPDHPFRHRVLRSKGLSQAIEGNLGDAATTLRAALAAPASTDFERAVTLRALAATAPTDSEHETWVSEIDEVRRRLDIAEFPSLGPVFVN